MQFMKSVRNCLADSIACREIGFAWSAPGEGYHLPVLHGLEQEEGGICIVYLCTVFVPGCRDIYANKH